MHQHRHWLTLLVVLFGFHQTAGGQAVRAFGPPKGEAPLPGFGSHAELYADLEALVIDSDRRNAIRDIKRGDKNGDWVLDTAEIKAVGYSLELNDLNRDGQIPLREMTLRWAQHRTRRDRARRAPPARRRAAGQSGQQRPAANPQRARFATDPDVRARNRLAADVARQIMSRFDKNRDNVLLPKEWQSTDTKFGNVAAADTNRNGRIGAPELARWFLRRLPPLSTSRLAPDLRLLDADQDGQVSLREFSSELTEETVAEFRRYDRNDDGLITARESQAAAPANEAAYVNDQVRVLPPQAIVTSAIWIEEDFTIADLDVRVSITKRSDDYLQLSLVGPGGQSVMLFRGRWQAWRGGPLFEQTVLDDEAKPINNLGRPPANRTFPPEGVGKAGVFSLSHYYGKRSRGQWRLVVRNLDEYGIAGLLREWSLLIKRRGD